MKSKSSGVCIPQEKPERCDGRRIRNTFVRKSQTSKTPKYMIEIFSPQQTRAVVACMWLNWKSQRKEKERMNQPATCSSSSPQTPQNCSRLSSQNKKINRITITPTASLFSLTPVPIPTRTTQTTNDESSTFLHAFGLRRSRAWTALLWVDIAWIVQILARFCFSRFRNR